MHHTDELNVKCLILYNLLFRFNAIPNKITAGDVIEIDSKVNK